jgi:hypothetical protein
MDGNITISKDEYLRLRLAEEKLNLLDGGGVDNWEWYSESLYPDKTISPDSLDFDEIHEKLKREIEAK